MRELQVSLLRNLRIRIIDVACNGKEAFDKFIGKKQYNLIICDWNMPKITGLEVLQRVRDADCEVLDEEKDEASQPTPNVNKTDTQVPFIMVTGESDKTLIVEAINAGVSDYISKPFQPQLFVDKVCKALKMPAPNLSE